MPDLFVEKILDASREIAIAWLSYARQEAVEEQDFDRAMAFRNAEDFARKMRPAPTPRAE